MTNEEGVMGVMDRVRGGVLDEIFQGTCWRVSEATGVKIAWREAAERLDAREQSELVGLFGKVTKGISGLPGGPGGFIGEVTFPEAAASQEFAKGLKRLKAPDASRRRGRELLLELTRSEQRVPSPGELSVLNAVPVDATLDAFRPALGAARRRDAAGGFVADSAGSWSVNPSALTADETKRFERLVEKAVDDDGLFDRRRKEAEMQKRVRELAARVKPQPAAKGRYEEAGALVLPRELFEWMAQEPQIIDAPMLTCLVHVLFQIENLTALSPGSRIETGEDGVVRLILNERIGFWGRLDPEGRLVSWRKGLKHLAANDWLLVAAQGGEWTISKGVRADLLDMKRGKAVAA